MRVYFLGILGISQSGLAEILAGQGNSIFGSDRTDNKELREYLENLGIKVFIGHDRENIKSVKPQLVVYNGAIADDNPELVWAIENDIKTVTRAECLGQIASGFKKVIAVSGCHGKTTTTALVHAILNSKNPTTHCGGEIILTDAQRTMHSAQLKINRGDTLLPEDNIDISVCHDKKNYELSKSSKATIIGGRDYFITEACEFKASFLEIKPDIAVVLNVDADHLDFYKNLTNVKAAFLKFTKNIKPGGVLIYNSDDKNSGMYKMQDNINKFSFGFNDDADFCPYNIRQVKDGISFRIKQIDNIRFYTNAYGVHNVLNAAAAVIVGLLCGLDSREIRSNLKTFGGVKRRMEEIENNLGLDIIHDYAHHPAEIKATIKTVKQHFKKSIIVIFQPHTYTRTKSLWNDFKACFNEADKTILVPIYSAREKPIKNITSEILAEQIKNCEYKSNFYEAENAAVEYAKINNSIILILGAGDIVEMTELFKNKKEENGNV